MYKYKCLNPIAKFGLDHFTREYVQVEELEEADALLSAVQPCTIWSCRRIYIPLPGREPESTTFPWESVRSRGL